MMHQELTIVMPVYNEEAVIDQVIHSWSHELDRLQIRHSLLVYDDGSPDRTAERLRTLERTVPHLRVVQQPNQGTARRCCAGIVRHAASGFFRSTVTARSGRRNSRACGPAGNRASPLIRCAALALGLASIGVLPASGQQTIVEVRVRALDRETGAALAGVDVALAAARGVTGSNGEARLARVPAGAHTLTARRLGYAAVELDVVIRRDTLLVLTLDVEPIPLDSIRAVKRTVTIRGTVRAEDTGERLADALVSAGRDRRTHTNRLGRFRLDRMPADDSIGIAIAAFRYNPASAVLLPVRDTTLEFVLQPDPVGRAMIAEQIGRLDQRVRRGAWAQQVLGRDALERHGGATAHDIVRRELGFRFSRIACLSIDDRPSLVGADELHAYGADEIERIEILDRGFMVRVYTGRFVQRMVAGRERVAPILLIKGRGRPICH